MFGRSTLLPLKIAAASLIVITTVIEFYFGIWYEYIFWKTIFGMFDVWTWLHQEYRDAFNLCKSVFFSILWKNRHFKRRFLPIHYIAACILIHEKQEKDRREREKLEGPKGSRDINEVFENSNAPSWMLDLAVAQKYMKVALAMYGSNQRGHIHRTIVSSCRNWLAFRWQNFVCFFFRPRHCVVKGDPWRRNLATLISQSYFTRNDIHYATFKNKLFAIPFCVFVYTETRSIVVSLRGSYSAADWMTNFTATLTDPGEIRHGWRAHKGMWQSAKSVFYELKNNKILEKLLENDKYKNYDLVVTGHSLGAGTSVLLGVLLREEYHHLRHRVKVYAFSCPGWLVNDRLAKACEEFVLVFALGDDIVLRAGVTSLNKLVNDGISELKKEITPSDHDMLNIIYKYIVIAAKKSWNPSMITDDPHDSATSTVYPAARGIGKQADQVEREVDEEQLYLPGRILHITKTRHKILGGDRLTMRLADKHEFLEILINRKTMFTDHVKENVLNAIDTVASYQNRKIN